MSKIVVNVESQRIKTVDPLDVYREMKRGNIEISSNQFQVTADLAPGMENGTKLDIARWLPFAAKEYHISPEISDYIFVPVIIFTSSLPNRNGIGFPLSELISFNVEHGKQAYETWKGKPTFFEHQNTDPTKAKGVIADTILRKLVGYSNDKLWKVINLCGFDRTKDPDLCNKILSGDLNTYSMGAWVDHYTCSFCHGIVGKQCNHIKENDPVVFYKLRGELVYRRVHGIVGFETSAVGSPAYPIATTDEIKHFTKN